MKIFRNKSSDELVKLLQNGGTAVMRTDTLYGVVARAADEAAVERIYALKGRDENKPFIVLISDTDMLYDQPGEQHQKVLAEFWPGPVSVIIPSPSAPEWLRRGGTTLAYRLPADDGLRALIARTGPLVAPSANPQGGVPAMNIEQAISYFGEGVGAYVDEGVIDPDTPPSRLYAIDEQGSMERLR